MTKQIKYLYKVELVYETSDSLKKDILSTLTKNQTQATKEKNEDRMKDNFSKKKEKMEFKVTVRGRTPVYIGGPLGSWGSELWMV